MLHIGFVMIASYVFEKILLPVPAPVADARRKREYFKAELERLRTSLKEDQAKIKTPPP